MKVNIQNKNILCIANKTNCIKNDSGKHSIKVMCIFGDIIWLHGKTQIYRRAKTKGFDISWLEIKNAFQGSSV